MRILMVHNYYRFRGGEDESCEQEIALLKERGHAVRLFARHNSSIDTEHLPARLALALNTVWSKDTYRALKNEIDDFTPDVAHFQNTFPLISPSAFDACRSRGIPVVQTLHNYRLICANGLLFRDGEICELCLAHRHRFPAVRYRCYRESRSSSALVALMLDLHELVGTWHRKVDRFIALTAFSKRLFVSFGLPPEKVAIKPNFVFRDPKPRRTATNRHALFVGRLSKEKGVSTLLRAWQTAHIQLPLVVVGTGEHVAGATAAHVDGPIRMVGEKPLETVYQLMKQAAFLVFPSTWYETFGRVGMEAFACGVPVIASRLGAIEALVEDGVTGLFFSPGDSADLAQKIGWAIAHPEEMAKMGRNARRVFETRFSREVNAVQLEAVYREAMAANLSRASDKG